MFRGGVGTKHQERERPEHVGGAVVGAPRPLQRRRGPALFSRGRLVQRSDANGNVPLFVLFFCFFSFSHSDFCGFWSIFGRFLVDY